MVIGVPKERKIHEYRIAVTPKTVRVLVKRGHQVIVEKGAGFGSGFTDNDFEISGATLAENEKEVYKRSKLILKVKEPIHEEFHLIQRDQILFTFLHLAANTDLLKALINGKSTAIAYETVQDSDGSLPILTPMSRIAGLLSIQIGLHYLEKPNGGKGILLRGAAGVRPGRVTVIGGGTVGYNAIISALGNGAEVTVIDNDIKKLEMYCDKFSGQVETLPSYPDLIEEQLRESDLVIGAVLKPGARAPKVITKKMIKKMEPGSVFVDLAIDQGGCSETSHPTNLDSPVYVVDDVTHYCVTNVPSLVSKTATESLSYTLLPYVLKIAEDNFDQDSAFNSGINVKNGDLLISLD
ncbi:alanine dehydrogenase [Desulfobacterota bacterium AH_259_B03_O07]|nr:alanine dehydrogenase [Desulfobacterota bacterium AH_259_B03_O07]